MSASFQVPTLRLPAAVATVDAVADPHDALDGASVVELLVSPAHAYIGRPGEGLTAWPDDRVTSLGLRAGLGAVGDRYFNAPAHRDASVTIMAAESLSRWPGVGLVQTRRTVLLRGVDVDAAAGRVLCLDCGDGLVRLRLVRRAHPCAWMDSAIAPGAWKALRGHGGMRCVPLDDGMLRVGPVSAAWID